MVKLTVHLEEAVVARLRELSRLSGYSRAELIRQAVSAFVQPEPLSRPEPVGVGQFRSGRTHIGRQAEELLRKAARGQSLPD
jgi:hypothetical protein